MSFEQRAEDADTEAATETAQSRIDQSDVSKSSEGDSSTATQNDGSVGLSAEGSKSESGSSDTPGFGRSGWVLTAALVSCMLLIPGILYFYPYVMASTGVTFFAAYIALPFVPALVLGAIAVWSMTGATSGTQ